MSAQKLLERLDMVKPCPGKHPQNWKARCPSHDDSDPSLSIAETTDGNVLINCWAGCTGHEVMDAVGLQWHELLPERLLQRPDRRPVGSSELDRQARHAIQYLNNADLEQVVLDYARLAREEGERLTDADLARERQAFEGLRRKRAA